MRHYLTLIHRGSPPCSFSLPIRPHLEPPPAHKVLRRNIYPQVVQRLRRQVAVVRPLHARVGIVALGVALHALQGQAHDLRKQLADLVLGVPVLR